MAFERATSDVPTTIGTVIVTLVDDPVDGQKVNYEIAVLDQDGQQMRVRGDIGNLVPHLTAGQITALQNFMADIRTKAVAELLP